MTTTKRNKIIYWIATIWLSLGMVATGIVQFIKMKEEVDKISQLGYPVYLLTLLAFWKMVGVITVLVPKLPVLKEWAYAGFFFAMSGAVFSHVASGSAPAELFGPILLIILTFVSWYFRPADRKIISVNQLNKQNDEHKKEVVSRTTFSTT